MDGVVEKKKENRKFIETVPTFVTFSSSYNKKFLQKMHDGQNYSWLFHLPCFDQRLYYKYDMEDGKKPRKAIIKPAPEPEDIIWTNLGQSCWRMIGKKLATFAISLVILCFSFGFIYLLTFIQYQLQVKNISGQSLNTFLSFAISLSLSLINIIINRSLFLTQKF
jgi:hypothetical protein